NDTTSTPHTYYGVGPVLGSSSAYFTAPDRSSNLGSPSIPYTGPFARFGFRYYPIYSASPYIQPSANFSTPAPAPPIPPTDQDYGPSLSSELSEAAQILSTDRANLSERDIEDLCARLNDLRSKERVYETGQEGRLTRIQFDSLRQELDSLEDLMRRRALLD